MRTPVLLVAVVVAVRFVEPEVAAAAPRGIPAPTPTPARAAMSNDGASGAAHGKVSDRDVLELRKATLQRTITTEEAELRSLQANPLDPWTKTRAPVVTRMLDETKAALAQVEAELAAPPKQILAAGAKPLGPNTNSASGSIHPPRFAAGATSVQRAAIARTLANEEGHKLSFIRLDDVMGKYRGETEKNLDRLFADAQRSGTVLFFDEADALFSKRASVSDNHDRYANAEVDYLLERIGQYRGTVILGVTTAPTSDPAESPKRKPIEPTRSP